jgi:hypothetical protein
VSLRKFYKAITAGTLASSIVFESEKFGGIVPRSPMARLRQSPEWAEVTTIEQDESLFRRYLKIFNVYLLHRAVFPKNRP